MQKKNTPFGFGMLAVLMYILGITTSSAQCPVVMSISPSSGPANTVVTLTGNNFQSGPAITSVHFNGVNAASYTIVSNTVIKAVVPANAANGAIAVESSGCPAAAAGNFSLRSSDCDVTTGPDDIFISELYDHTPGSYGAIEVYNPTNSTIVFNGQYVLERYGTWSDQDPTSDAYIFTLPGSIGPGQNRVVQSYGTGVQGCSVANVGNMGTGINADDAIKLKKNGVVIDVARAPSYTGYTVIRNPDANDAPTATYNVADWNMTGAFTCAGLGSHVIDPQPPIATIITQPENQMICANGTAMFSVALSDATGFTFQWKTLDSAGNWVNVTDGPNHVDSNTPTLTVDPAPMSFNGNQYYCEITAGECTLLSNAAHIIIEPAVTLAIVQPTCTTTTGSVTATPVSGTGLTYQINNGDFQSSPTFNLNPGNYTLTIQSASGCTATMPVVINPVPAGPAIATVTVEQPVCATPTGSITVTAPTGDGFTYSIDGTTFDSATVFDGLIPGSYIITVKNAEGCTSVTGAIVIDAVPNAPDVATVTVEQPTCTTPTGSITVTAPTDAGLTYSINGTVFDTTTTFGGLLPGTYAITVKNGDGCTSVTGNIIIDAAPNAPDVATVFVTQPTCDVQSGTITVTAPADGTYTYSLDGTTFQSSETFAGLIPGTYVVTVKNTEGCTSVTGNIIINAVPNVPAVATVTVEQPTCTLPVGSITVTAPTDAGLTYSIDGIAFDTVTAFENLVPGTYTITVKNAEGCTSVTGNIVINNAPNAPDPVVAATIQPTCALPTGTITVTNPTGASLTYSLDGITFQNSPVFAGLMPGTYTVTVKNTEGCTSVSGSIAIDTLANAPDPATVTIIQPTCLAPEGTITITAPVAAGLTYSLDGVTFQSSLIFAGLIPGTYTVTVKNAEGCISVSINHIVDPAPNGPAAPTVTVEQPTCAITTGTITITAPAEAGLEYSLDGITFQAGNVFEGLAPGSYAITLKNAGGCTTTGSATTINAVPEGPQVTGTQGCRDTAFGSNYILEGLPLAGSFDIATTDFEWRDANGTVTGNNENIFNVTQYVADNGIAAEAFPLEFTLTVTTAAGCETTYLFTVEASFCSIPRGISPNNDTLNDNFDITGLHASKVAIFNRYGQEVYARNNYTNQWHGQADNGDELPTGTYYYIIEAPGNSYTGWVYINRMEN
ncbi:gliding motility-associated C-terminal domain-containing protein [uncultured Flavobacterium sp.]|uniref:T9SS type B sorting domain-containing protein n=1 Tax=uncultured Flavobacterium sp. TaxID=165435 RepID=UPI0025CCEE08|nr:gliding motility-associated C-terminal domain-containing protein [uncultured Flavobacterium sp.]